MELVDYSVQSVTEGIEALAVTRVSLRPAGKLASEGFTINAQVSFSHGQLMMCLLDLPVRRV